MNLGNVTALAIPEGNVAKITSGTAVLWEAPVEENIGPYVRFAMAMMNNRCSLYATSIATAAVASITAGDCAYVIGNTAANGRYPCVYNGGLYWIDTDTYGMVKLGTTWTRPLRVSVTNKVAHSRGWQTVYTDSQMTQTDAAAAPQLGNYACVELLSRGALTEYGSCLIHYDNGTGTNYQAYFRPENLTQVIDLSAIDLSAFSSAG